jgi:aminoglycoside/choline kinase family phosphotransferase
MSDRTQQLKQWLGGLGYRDYRLAPASEDASFRSYLRLETGDASFVVMDAPPDKEPCDSFIAVAKQLRDAGLSAPEVIAQNLEHGFLLLTDFGNASYLSQLDATTAPALYVDAIAALHVMQAKISTAGLPLYDEALLRREMDLFHDWFLNRLFEITLEPAQQESWQRIKQDLVDNALAQPQVFVHRDYHSRNLMHLNSGNPGILDFQDAVRGPVTYDLVSLLRDCYIDWPLQQVEEMALGFYRQAHDQGRVDVDADQFMHWFDRMGIQRQLKAIGIFSRLWIRDGKRGYLKDIPRTFGYLREVCRRDPAMAPLFELVEALNLSARIEGLE